MAQPFFLHTRLCLTLSRLILEWLELVSYYPGFASYSGACVPRKSKRKKKEKDRKEDKFEENRRGECHNAVVDFPTAASAKMLCGDP